MPAPRPVSAIAAQQPLAREVIDQRFAAGLAAAGTAGDLTWISDDGELPAAIDAAYDEASDVVVLPAGLPTLTGAVPGRVPARSDRGPRLVRVDAVQREPDRCTQLSAHIYGRGAEGISYAVRACANHARWPVTTYRYGPHPEQFAELRLPRRGSGPPPVVMLLHGGLWRSRWQLDLMDAVSIDLARRGIASWNVEYRRPDRHGWAMTTADVDDAARYLSKLGERELIDPRRVAVAGSSSGGQLAVRAAADLHRAAAPIRPLLVVSLAGVLDLIEGHRRDVGMGAISAALGGDPDALPAVYQSSSPLRLAPTQLPSLVVIGETDSADFNEMGYRYAAAVRAAGGTADVVVGKGGHFSLIDPEDAAWTEAARHLEHSLGTDT